MRLEQRRQPAAHVLVEADRAGPPPLEAGPHLGPLIRLRHRLAQSLGIQQRHGAALAQLRAHGMGGVANDAQPALAPTVQNHVSIGGLKQIRGGRQPCQQWFEIRPERGGFLFPLLERMGAIAPVGHVGHWQAPEKAQQRRVGGVRSTAGGQNAGHAMGALVTLAQPATVETGFHGHNRPQCAPRILAVIAHPVGGTQMAVAAVGDQGGVEAMFALVSPGAHGHRDPLRIMAQGVHPGAQPALMGVAIQTVAQNVAKTGPMHPKPLHPGTQQVIPGIHQHPPGAGHAMEAVHRGAQFGKGLIATQLLKDRQASGLQQNARAHRCQRRCLLQQGDVVSLGGQYPGAGQSGGAGADNGYGLRLHR